MEDLFVKTVFLFSIAVAGGAIVSSIVGYLAQRQATRHVLDTLEETKLDEALDSDDIAILGSYLESSLDNVTIMQYSTDIKVAARVDRYLQHIQAYVGTTEEVERETESVGTVIAHHFPPVVDSTDEGRRADGLQDTVSFFEELQSELRTGETWNSLARLRRYIELTLRDFAKSRGYDERRLNSAGRIIRLLRVEDDIDEDTTEFLEYAVAVANRAVHGLDVSQEEVERAVESAQVALLTLPDN